MSRNFRRAAFGAATTAAAALSAAAMRSAIDPYLPSFGLSTSPPAYAAAPGHLALARAHPDLDGLDEVLSPDALLLDATHAYAAAALRCRPISGEDIRRTRCEHQVAAMVEMAEARGGAEEVLLLRVVLALGDAKDGRFEDALAALERLAAERPGDPRPRLSAAGICYLLGMMDEGNEWISGIPEEVRLENKVYLRKAILAAALGGAPCAVSGLQVLVGFAAFERIDVALCDMFHDGHLSLLQKMVLRALVWRAVAAVAGDYKDYW